MTPIRGEAPPMSAFMTIDRPQRVELGPSFIADIARNVCYLRTHQSQIGPEADGPPSPKCNFAYLNH
jgi:hypothetical protein